MKYTLRGPYHFHFTRTNTESHCSHRPVEMCIRDRNNNYRVLSTNKEKQEILKERGIDYLLECPFTKEVMCMEPVSYTHLDVYKRQP